MSAYRIHCVVVGGLTEDVHGTRLVWGVVSDLDLARAVASGQEATAGQVAATEPLTASPYDTLTDVAQVMAEHEVAHLVVIDGVDAEPMGMISTLDLARAYSGGG
jgi:CBS domain-containing protein